MKKIVSFTLFFCFIFIAGCQDSFEYDDEEVAAIIRGEELTIGELRFLYPDDEIFENLEGTIKGKLAVQEAKEMQLTIKEPSAESQRGYPAEDDTTDFAAETRAFAEEQGKKFGLEPEEYFEKYAEQTQETSLYVIAYINEMIGELDDNPKEYSEQGNQLLDDLYEDNLDEIEILME